MKNLSQITKNMSLSFLMFPTVLAQYDTFDATTSPSLPETGGGGDVWLTIAILIAAIFIISAIAYYARRRT